MNANDSYFYYHLANNLKTSVSSLVKVATKIASDGDISQHEAIQLLAKPTNIRSARSLIELCCEPDDLFPYIKSTDVGV